MTQHHPQQWHNVVATQNIGWEDGPDGKAVLLVPRFRKGPLAKWLQPKLKRPYMRVNLDDIGTFAWKGMDGTTPFHELAENMKKHFGDKVDPAEDRLKRFMTILYKDKFVTLTAPTKDCVTKK